MLNELIASLILNLITFLLRFARGNILEENKHKNDITQNIDTVNAKLLESKQIIEKAMGEIEEQKKIFEQMKQEAEISRQVSLLNQDQVNAFNTILSNTLDRQERKSLPKNIGLSLFFCVLGAVLGFILGKLF